MSRIFFVALATALGWTAWAGAAESAGRYAVVVKKDVADGPWGKVVRFLEAKHKGQVFAYDKSPEDVRKGVGAYHPRYVCFVIQESGEKGVVRMTYKVKVNFVGEGNKRTAEKFGGWRIFTYLLPYQVTETKVERTDFKKVVLPGETIIWDAGIGLKPGDERSVVFTGKRVLD